MVADPAGGTNKVGQLAKPTGAEQWSGTTISTEPDNAVPAIPFTASKTKMTVRGLQPAAGIRVRMKVEKAGNPGINCETDAFTTTADGWETLT